MIVLGKDLRELSDSQLQEQLEGYLCTLSLCGARYTEDGAGLRKLAEEIIDEKDRRKNEK